MTISVYRMNGTPCQFEEPFVTVFSCVEKHGQFQCEPQLAEKNFSLVWAECGARGKPMPETFAQCLWRCSVLRSSPGLGQAYFIELLHDIRRPTGTKYLEIGIRRGRGSGQAD